METHLQILAWLSDENEVVSCLLWRCNAASFAVTDCWQVYKGRHTAAQVFAMIDTASVQWKPLVRSKVKCQSQSVLEKAAFWISNNTFSFPFPKCISTLLYFYPTRRDPLVPHFTWLSPLTFLLVIDWCTLVKNSVTRTSKQTAFSLV